MNKKHELFEILKELKRGNKMAAEAYDEILLLFNVVGRSEQLKAVEKLKDFAYEVCPLHREDDLEEIVGSL